MDTTNCTHISGPCVDGTAAGRRCGDPGVSRSSTGEPRCMRHTQPGLLPAGAITDLGVIVRSTLTAYERDSGEFVAFQRVHGKPAPVMPLVVLR